MRRLKKSRLIRIYTVCHSVLIFDWNPYLEQWVWPTPKMEEATSDLGMKGLKRVFVADANSEDADEPEGLYSLKMLYNTSINYTVSSVHMTLRSMQRCNMGHSKRKDYFEQAQNAQIHIYSAHAYSDICSPLMHSIVSNDYISGQWRPWSDCADARSDLGLRCPHMLEDTFSHGAAHKTLYRRRCNVLSTLRARGVNGQWRSDRSFVVQIWPKNQFKRCISNWKVFETKHWTKSVKSLIEMVHFYGWLFPWHDLINI